MLKLIRSLFALSYVAIFLAIAPPASHAVIAEQPCNQVSWTGEDDNAHEMTLPYNLPLGDTTYNNTYVTTNGTLTFGTPDATFSSYPNTPSISLAGWDWVTWSGGLLSYGVTDTGFCVEWKVRSFPLNSGEFTNIKLTVDTSRLPTWSGIVETTGWLPADLRRGIRFQPGQDVVTISEAFTINGGRPVEMQSCWDGSVIPMSSTCPAEPPAGQCWDGSTVPWNGTCPPIPPDTQCWDGTWVSWSQTCAPEPEPITCWDGSVIPGNQTCPATPPDIVCWDNSVVPWNGTCTPIPPDIQCWDGTSVPWNGTCSEEPQVTCWDNSVVHYQSECSPIPPDITCWDGQVVPWNGTCRQVPPPIDCWDGSSVNWNEQCPVEPPAINIYPEGAIFLTANEGWDLSYTAPEGFRIAQILFASYGTPVDYQLGLCNATNSLQVVLNRVTNNILSIGANNSNFGDPCGGTYKHLSVVLTIEVDPTYVEPTPTPSPTPTDTVTPTPEPSPTVEPTETPTPTPTPSETSSPTPSPQPTETQQTKPTSQPSPEQSPSEQPTVEPSPQPSETSSPEPTPTEEPTSVDELLNQYSSGEAIPADQLAELGIDYSQLPPETPVMLENGVVITAEVADALEIFEDPAELLSAVFTDPGKAIKAIANIGADMSPSVRKDAQAVTVSAVVVSQVIAGTSALTLARK